MKKILLLTFPALLVFSAGCASTYSYRGAMEKIHPAYAVGDFKSATDVTTTQIEGGAASPLVWQLNHAALLQAEGDHARAGECWDDAIPMFEDLWLNERGLLAKSALGMLPPGLGDSAYYARPHEGVMLYTYAFLNAWQRGETAEAGRLLKCLITYRDQVFAEAERRVEKRRARGITDDASLAESTVGDELSNSKQKDLDKVSGDSPVVANSIMGEIEQRRKAELREDLDGYANYANPLAGFLAYLYLKTQGTGAHLTDINDAKREIDELSVFAPRNSVVRFALENNVEVMDDGSLYNTAFVFFETGRAPRQEEVRFEAPLPGALIASWFPSYAGVAYPELVSNPDHVPQLAVQAGRRERVPAELLVDFDALVQQSFDDEWPAILARQIAQAVLAVTVNAALNYAGNKAAENIENDWVRIGTQVAAWGATALLGHMMVGADERSWELLPKQVHVARVDIPEDRKITLLFPRGTWRQDVTLGAGDVMAVWVKSTSPWQLAPVATQFRLK